MARKVVDEIATGMQLELEELRKQVAGLQEQVQILQTQASPRSATELQPQSVNASLDASALIAVQTEVRKFALQMSKFDLRLNALEYRMDAARL